MKIRDENKIAIRTPFPYFGSKRKVAAEIWKRFGEPKAYIEPFAGSLSVLLGRPEATRTVSETVNDADGLLVNFWRAVKAVPDDVLKFADHPITATDLTARHKLLLDAAEGLQKRLEENSDYYDAMLAGFWVWGMSSGMQFCVQGIRPTPRNDRSGLGFQRASIGDLTSYFAALQERLRRVHIHSGDWQRLVRPCFFAQGNGKTAIFLDPPYSKKSGRSKTRLYRFDDRNVALATVTWAMEHGNDPNLRIAFCGLAGEHEFPPTWEEFRWTNHGGRTGTRDRERIWFSPHCIPPYSPAQEAPSKAKLKRPKGDMIAISDIQIGHRHRKDIGDFESLAANIKEHGLLQPIGIKSDKTLVFGERRLRACKELLGWTKIPARIVDVQSIAHGEFAENELRKQYTPSERYAIIETLRRFEHGGDRRSDQDRNCDNELLTTNEASNMVGFSKDDFYRVKKVIQKGVSELVQAMDSGEISISAAAQLADANYEEQRAVLAKPNNEDRWTATRIRKQLHRVRKTKEVAEAEAKVLAEPQATDQVRLYHCAFQDLEERSGLAPNSVNLICTDFPYTDEFVSEVEGLTAFAERVLVPGGTFVSYIGQHRLPEKIASLGKHLAYRWLCPAVWTGAGNSLWHLNLVSKSQMIVVYSKGEWTPAQRWVDLFLTEHPEKYWHEWQRPLPEVERLISYFSKPGDFVVDPCGGGFTTAVACERLGRRCISCDIDKSCVVRGQERLAQEQSKAKPILLPDDYIGIQESREPPGMAG